MKTIPAGKFKINCLAIMDEVKAMREPVVDHQARPTGGEACGSQCGR